MKFKFNNQALIVGALFILLVVLCFSWVSREMFSEHNVTNHMANRIGTNTHNLNMVNSSNVSRVNAMSRDKFDPEGNNGFQYFQTITHNSNSMNKLPPQ